MDLSSDKIQHFSHQVIEFLFKFYTQDLHFIGQKLMIESK